MKKWINYLWLLILMVGLMSVAYLYAIQGDQENYDAMGIENNAIAESAGNRAVVFQIPDDELSDNNYVKNGELKKEGQFKYTSLGQRIELRQMAPSKLVVKNGKLNYKFKSVKLLVNSSKTIEAQQHTRNQFNDQDLGRQFMSVQVNYTLENNNDFDVYTDGVVAVSYMNGTAVTALSGLDNDEHLKSPIPAHGKVHTGMTVLVPASQRDQLQTMTFEFASVYNRQGKLITAKTAPHKISF